MMKLGVNTVLFKPFSIMEAMKAIKAAGYDGVELSAIQMMNPHLDLTSEETTAASIAAIEEAKAETGLQLLSMELASQDPVLVRKGCAAAKKLGVPIVNVGPTGKTGVEGDKEKCIETLKNTVTIAAAYGITVCMKAHAGASVYNTDTTLDVMAAIKNDNFGVDMDPSHIFRAGENPEEALPKVVQGVKHIHIRDCAAPDPNAAPPVMPDGTIATNRPTPPGPPAVQACGRGCINLYGYFKALVDAQFEGPVCLEVIGPDQTLANACTIAAESYGYMNALLKMLGAR